MDRNKQRVAGVWPAGFRKWRGRDHFGNSDGSVDFRRELWLQSTVANKDWSNLFPAKLVSGHLQDMTDSSTSDGKGATTPQASSEGSDEESMKELSEWACLVMFWFCFDSDLPTILQAWNRNPHGDDTKQIRNTTAVSLACLGCVSVCLRECALCVCVCMRVHMNVLL